MPAILDRCVSKVIAKGHSESSAFAICRSSLGLAGDGSEDGKKVEMGEEEMDIKVENELKHGPTLRKKMVVATPIGKFENADQEGVMDRKRLRSLADNFRDFPRQVPIFALGEHVEELDSRPPDGWVESVSITGKGELEIDAKLHGKAAGFVLNDLIRGASIGTVEAKDHDGTEIGEVLHHVLLTNNPFIKGLNIAAAQVRGGERAVCFFTALNEEKPMAKGKKLNLQDHPGETEEEKKKREEKEKNLQEEETEEERKKREEEEKDLEKEMIALKADLLRAREENENLRAKLANAFVDKDKEAALIENANLKKDLFAMKVRSIVEQGLKGGTLKAAWCDGYAGKGAVDFTGTLRWLKASRFGEASPGSDEDAFKLLKFTAENNPPLYRVGQTFKSGTPADTGAMNLSDDEKKRIRKLGLSPERISAMGDNPSYEEWKQLKAEEGK